MFIMRPLLEGFADGLPGRKGVADVPVGHEEVVRRQVAILNGEVEQVLQSFPGRSVGRPS